MNAPSASDTGRSWLPVWNAFGVASWVTGSSMGARGYAGYFGTTRRWQARYRPTVGDGTAARVAGGHARGTAHATGYDDPATARATRPVRPTRQPFGARRVSAPRERAPRGRTAKYVAANHGPASARQASTRHRRLPACIGLFVSAP
ncbi:hypothetical protein GCM10023205_38780 [Yinghuangia aomiensis]|uniref:Uncharacterized protein n=1 Tax=Yinghuangia aomiensis TaxID=676205 RepID=A0ABP9HFM8_9ACTN